METPFEIYPYSINKLIDIFSDKSISNPEFIQKNIHSIYFREYFEHLDTKTILAENDYIDRDYLEDFSSYYVRCFADYKRKCTRLHFFKHDFCVNDFEALLNESNPSLQKALQQNYLGFVVVKPLPKTIIGRTCLVPYPKESGKERKYPITREYKVNLFGLPLSVKSLAFQEQDNVVAACATSALWSVFHGTGILFHHDILSPGEITKTATKQLPIESRVFPNRGLSGEQMAYAIRSVNLEPLQIGINNKEYNIKSSIYAYISYGIPLILGLRLYDISGRTPNYIGRHAVAVTGYSIEDQTTKYENENLKLVSSNINKIYVHDDQVGPFSRMVFDNRFIKLHKNGTERDFISLATSFKTEGTGIGGVRAVPEILLVPLYHKIRISFDTIYATVKFFNEVIEQVNEEIPFLMNEKIEWDIYLTDVNKLKSEIFEAEKCTGNYFKKILLMNMPRYIWRAAAILKGTPVIDFLFDATDIEQGQYFICTIEYDKGFSSILKKIFSGDIFEEMLKNTTAWKIIRWLRDDSHTYREAGSK